MLQTYDLADRKLIPGGGEKSRIQLYSNPTPEERLRLISELKLDQHSLASALDPDEISRLELGPAQVLLIWKHPDNYSFSGEVRFNVSSIGLVLAPDRLVVIMAENVSLFDEGHSHSLGDLNDVALHILAQTTRHFLEHLKIIKTISREVQQKINTALENEHLIQMFTLGESLTYYLNAITSNTSVLTKMRSNTERLRLSPAQVEYLDDIMIENNQCCKQAEIYSNVMSGLMDFRGTLVNNNMNVILKNLTIINTIFLPLTLIASVGGMSEYSRLMEGVDWRISYGIFGLAMVVLGWFTSIVIKKFSGWQRKKRR